MWYCIEIGMMIKKTAFFYADLTEEISLYISEGFETESNKNKLHQLKKSLCGLKQAPLFSIFIGK